MLQPIYRKTQHQQSTAHILETPLEYLLEECLIFDYLSLLRKNFTFLSMILFFSQHNKLEVLIEENAKRYARVSRNSPSKSF
jgi:hypothetical protein